jgi:hypothetical protein
MKLFATMYVLTNKSVDKREPIFARVDKREAAPERKYLRNLEVLS